MKCTGCGKELVMEEGDFSGVYNEDDGKYVLLHNKCYEQILEEYGFGHEKEAEEFIIRLWKEDNK